MSALDNPRYVKYRAHNLATPCRSSYKPRWTVRKLRIGKRQFIFIHGSGR